MVKLIFLGGGGVQEKIYKIGMTFMIEVYILPKMVINLVIIKLIKTG